MTDDATATELQLRTGPYRTTFIGTEIIRKSTPDEWKNYGEILKRVDEAKQWAIGDWLVDGNPHYGDGTYKQAEKILGVPERTLQDLKWMADFFEFTRRRVNCTWGHHREVSSVKRLLEDKKGKLHLSDEPDWPKIDEFLYKVETEGWSVRELREEVMRYKRQQQEMIRLANEPEKYTVIYADPPWQYNDKRQDFGGAEDHYPTLSIEELCRLPVKNRAADNAVLFMWVTSPLLDECWPVIEAWGFEYRACFIWDKVRPNLGHYNSVRHELLLICIKGSYTPEITPSKDSVVTLERTGDHSEKPPEFRALIDELYPTGNRIELFARGDVPKPWAKWGDEAE